jgi:hypothetical protein
MNVELVKPVGRNPGGVARLVIVGVGIPVERERMETDHELLAGLAGVGVDDDVAGIGVHAGEAGDLDGDPGFLGDLALGGSGGRLPEVDATTRKLPDPVVGPTDQQDPVASSRTTANALGAKEFGSGALGSW